MAAVRLRNPPRRDHGIPLHRYNLFVFNRLKTNLKRYTPLAVASILPSFKRGVLTASQWKRNDPLVSSPKEKPNPLRDYFNSINEGPGIWKWDHYFDTYHRHLQKFVGQDVHVAEVGVYSGGSLKMWQSYFGPNCHLYGIDHHAACKIYENENTKIFIGDQADRGFWERFRREVKELDVLLDDGGHQLEQRIVTLEEIVPHLRPGGVYICEDVHQIHDKFAAYVHGLASGLYAFQEVKEGLVTPTPLQQSVFSIHFYPFLTVIEKRSPPIEKLWASKRGTEWQPFPWW